MKKSTILFSLAAATGLFAGLPSSQAVVTPGDTFSFALIGFNQTSRAGFYLTPQETATFGVASTFAAAGIDGQDITITSSETIGAVNTTDTFTVSTPTNFLNEATISGTTIDTIQFDLGDSNSGGNTISVLTPITSYSDSGTVIYGPVASPTSSAVAPNTMITLGGGSYADAEGVNSATGTAISTYGVHGFTYTLTYATVPEPTTWAAMGVGGLALAGSFLRRRKVA